MGSTKTVLRTQLYHGMNGHYSHGHSMSLSLTKTGIKERHDDVISLSLAFIYSIISQIIDSKLQIIHALEIIKKNQDSEFSCGEKYPNTSFPTSAPAFGVIRAKEL